MGLLYKSGILHHSSETPSGKVQQTLEIMLAGWGKPNSNTCLFARNKAWCGLQTFLLSLHSQCTVRVCCTTQNAIKLFTWAFPDGHVCFYIELFKVKDQSCWKKCPEFVDISRYSYGLCNTYLRLSDRSVMNDLRIKINKKFLSTVLKYTVDKNRNITEFYYNITDPFKLFNFSLLIVKLENMFFWNL